MSARGRADRGAGSRASRRRRDLSASVRPGLRGDRRRVRRPGQVGQLARARRAARRGAAARLPGQPARRRGPGPAGVRARSASCPSRPTSRCSRCRRRRSSRRSTTRSRPGARAVVVITAGEADGDAGGARDRALAARARAAGRRAARPELPRRVRRRRGARARLERPPARPDRADLPERQPRARDRRCSPRDAGLGFSRFVSVGNQADVQVAELVGELAAHAATELIAVYVEDFRDGRAFAAAAEAAARAGKPVLLLAIEHTEATARAVRSHTGALASDGAAIDAACRAAGIVRVHAPQELVDVADGLLRAGPGRAGAGSRVLADGGGHGGDRGRAAAAAPGSSCRGSASGCARELRGGLPPTAARLEPDRPRGRRRAGHPRASTARRARCSRSGEVDARAADAATSAATPSTPTRWAAPRRRSSRRWPTRRARPAARSSCRRCTRDTPASDAAAPSRRAGVPARSSARWTSARGWRRGERAATACRRCRRGRAGRAVGGPRRRRAARYDGTRARAARRGAACRSPARARSRRPPRRSAAAAELGYPVVLKALGPLHKSDAGGVALGLRDEAALVARGRRTCERGSRRPRSRVERDGAAGATASSC